MKRSLQILYVIPVVAFLFAPLFLRGGVEAGGEKRELAPRPTLELNAASVAAFPGAFDKYYRDHFGLRHALVRLYARLCVFGLGVSPVERVVVGKEHWLFLNSAPLGDGDSLADYRGTDPLPAAQREKLRSRFEDLRLACEGQGIDFRVVLVPGKGAIYPDRLPARLHRVTPYTPTDDMLAYLAAEAPRLKRLDLRPALARAAKEETVYFRTDTHWNDRGARAASSAITGWLAADYPALGQRPEPEWHVEPAESSGDLAGMLALPDLLQETWDRLTPVQGWRHRVEPGPGGLYDDVVCTRPGGDRALRAVVLRDSFGNGLLPFLAESFGRTVYHWYTEDLGEELIAREKPDLVLLLLADRRLRWKL